MVYTKTTWLETSMSSAQKLAGLDNLETLYTEAVSYIDAISHSERYYDEGACDAKYFTSANDGTGSGLICATLDGYTADEIIAGGTPSGCIAIWSGSEVSIPSGWYLCNGLNGTPDLRNRFVVGSGSHYVKGNTGGANTATTTATVTIAGHTLTAGEIPKHTHGSITDYYATGSANGMDYTYNAAWMTSDVSTNTGYTGGGGSHTHTATWDGTDDQSTIPPFYAACYIMKA